MKLEKVTKNTYKISVGYTDIGIYAREKMRAVLIDTGSDFMPELADILEENDMRATAVINTHLHVDHIGNNDLIHDRYDADVFASEEEIDHERDGEYGIAGYLQANPHEGKLETSGGVFEILPSPGHSVGHQFVVTPDGVCFLGDALLSVGELMQTKLPYHKDIGSALASMKKILRLEYSRYVFSHRGVFSREETAEAVEANMAKETQLLSMLKELLNDRIDNETLIDVFMDKIGIAKDKRQLGWVRQTVLTRIEMLRQNTWTAGSHNGRYGAVQQ